FCYLRFLLLRYPAVTNYRYRNLRWDLRRRKVFRHARGSFLISLTIRGQLRFSANPQARDRERAILRFRLAKVLTDSLVPGIARAFGQDRRHLTREKDPASVEK